MLLVDKGSSISEKEYLGLVNLLGYSDIAEADQEYKKVKAVIEEIKLLQPNIIPQQVGAKFEVGLTSYYQVKNIVPEQFDACDYFWRQYQGQGTLNRKTP